MDKNELKAWIEELIANNELWKFYKHPEWIKVKEEVLKTNHYECAICRSKGKITRYDVDKNGVRHRISTVHHNQFVRKHPELALSKTYTYNGKEYINLIPVCKKCHNQLHPEKRKKGFMSNNNSFKNIERW